MVQRIRVNPIFDVSTKVLKSKRNGKSKILCAFNGHRLASLSHWQRDIREIFLEHNGKLD